MIFDAVGYRRLAGVTQAEMASHMQVPFRTYQDIEAGKVEFRPIHHQAARMALIALAIQKEDSSILPPGLADLVVGAADLVWARAADIAIANYLISATPDKNGCLSMQLLHDELASLGHRPSAIENAITGYWRRIDITQPTPTPMHDDGMFLVNSSHIGEIMQRASS
ncbi:helix-turn-helix domain-containing protein [Mesorhizobium sp. AR02]|uniref:helix-turn-helix domain-containing protein n=1 Tax=Mesorhizobium sp. AR02 TaxID=2865837 RepID=UPI002160FA9C|nr:helix-turn-helix transcriptional regulator [Mesorhizobium sp. AR02]UVK51487.1 helix-turn-helix domain-containing protein [Mesorhizobium sp. AR02]